jgi:branched-chain amino acid transport system substrate-binding protein
LIGGIDIASTERLGKAAQPYDVPLLSIAELPSIPLGDNIFTTNASMKAYGWTLAQFAFHELKVKGASIVTDRNPYSSSFGEAFSKEFSVAGESAFEGWPFRSGAELGRLAELLKKAGTEALVFVGSPSELGNFRSKIKSLGSSLPVLFGKSAVEFISAPVDPEVVSGIFLGSPFVSEAPDQAKFVKSYTDRFRKKPNAIAASAYDAITVLASALRDAPSLKAKDVKETLLKREREYPCLLGRFKFDESHALQRPLFIVKIEGNEFRQIKQESQAK